MHEPATKKSIKIKEIVQNMPDEATTNDYQNVASTQYNGENESAYVNNTPNLQQSDTSMQSTPVQATPTPQR